jgi:hypothetical protein
MPPRHAAMDLYSSIINLFSQIKDYGGFFEELVPYQEFQALDSWAS